MRSEDLFSRKQKHAIMREYMATEGGNAFVSDSSLGLGLGPL